MPPPPEPDPPDPVVSPARRKFIQRISELPIKPTARDYYLRWAESWTKALGHPSAGRTQAYFDALGRSASIADWQQSRGTEGFWTERSIARRARRRAEPPSQFRQAADAARILACDVLALPWASVFDWQGFSDQARALELDHRTLTREAIPIRASTPPALSRSGPLPATDHEIARITDALRRSVRLVGHAYATEETYVYWSTRFTRFCLLKLKQPPKDAVPAGITAYLKAPSPSTMARAADTASSPCPEPSNSASSITLTAFAKTPPRPRRRRGRRPHAGILAAEMAQRHTRVAMAISLRLRHTLPAPTHRKDSSPPPPRNLHAAAIQGGRPQGCHPQTNHSSPA